MTHQNTNPVPEPDQPAASGFSAQSQMGLAEVMQMCCLSRRSGQITFRSGESYGYVFIQHGKVLHAMCGTIEGEEAVYNMLTWPGGGFNLDEDILPHKKTITLTWEQLLFEGARRADEGTSAPPLTSSGPVKTAPVSSTRTQESQPKLTIIRPDLPPATFELTTEYTHLGRVQGNEICLPYPSISSRHCIFIQSGADIVLRDLNSSNGTIVNGEPVNEVILRPGDQIQTGVVQMKFEAGIKRPKLQPVPASLTASGPNLKKLTEPIKAAAAQPATLETIPLPKARPRPAEVKDDSEFVKGAAPISYDTLAKPAPAKKEGSWTIAFLIIGIALLAIGAYCFFFLR